MDRVRGVLLLLVAVAGCNREALSVDASVDAVSSIDLAQIDESRSFDFRWTPPFDAGACLPDHIDARLGDPCVMLLVCAPDQAGADMVRAIAPGFMCGVDGSESCPWFCSWSRDQHLDAATYETLCAVTELPFHPMIECAVPI
jgi:hypothetical protein